MSKNIKLNDTNYSEVSIVQLPTNEGGTATFKDVDEITTPSGGSGSSENSYEMGTFTLDEVTTNYTYEHSLGRVPKFAIVYPISLNKNTSDTEHHTNYTISAQYILNGLGQDNYNISSKDLIIGNNPFAQYYGTGYSSNVDGGSWGFDATCGTNLEFTETTVVVGAQCKIGATSGHLTVGTYGIIVG